MCSPSFFSLPAACRLFSRGVIFTRSHFARSIILEEKWGTTRSLRLHGRLQEVRLRSNSTMWSEYSLLVLLVIGLVSAVTNFYRGDVKLKFSFLLVLRLSLHAVTTQRTRPVNSQ